jgi:hypothetical protein
MVVDLLKRTRRGKVGYLSLAMLLLFTFSNFALEIVTADRPSGMGLGTAAISFVTEALSPILPFTGGVDLRREEHWDTSDGWIHTATSMIDQVRDAFGIEPMLWSIPRGGAQSASAGTKARVMPAKRKVYPHVSTLSAATPFVPVSSIADMTLGDLTAAFRYAIESTRPDFNEKRFLDTINDRMKPIIMGLKNAAAKSRGEGVEPAATNVVSSKFPAMAGDNVDALQFCAAMRLFAEWRVVRQVPDGYKAFAVGMSLGQKDVLQNVAKIEKAVHDWIEYRRDLLDNQSQLDGATGIGYDTCPASPGSKDCTLRSPTLRQLLEHEVDLDTHDNSRLPRLKDKTAAMGLLWVRRQLQYQTALFANILQVPTKFSTTNRAVQTAYNDVYDQYHGWAVQKIFGYSFQAAPEAHVIYRYMNPHQLKVSFQRARLQLKSTRVDSVDVQSDNDLNPFQKVWEKIVDIFDNDSSDIKSDNELNPFQKVWEKIVDIVDNDSSDIKSDNELNPFQKVWEKIVDIFDNDSRPVVGVETIVMGGQEVEAFVTQEMTEDAHNHISLYLDIIQPVLGELSGLFNDLNMDDPTKV